jgi:ARG and Rhodanese-Phosphatase-superfamily-associated Protein domain
MKPKHMVTIAIFCLLVALPIRLLTKAQAQGPSSSERKRSDQTVHGGGSNYTLSGPYTHKNLTIFLVHGQDLISSENFLTLQEALAQKKVIVYETRDVNELTIKNLSNQDIYVQSGDIVKGGDQDRMISTDFIVPPNSGRMPIAAFCVESGRWSRRGSEGNASFGSSENSVTSKEIKLAAKHSNSQEAVWANVAATQDKLSRTVGETVNSRVSNSSLELAVENPRVKETAAGYVRALSQIVKKKSDVIGFVFAINGQLNSADIYSSSTLFAKLWPKLLKASAVEALAEVQSNKTFEAIKHNAVQSFLSKAEKGTASEKDVTKRVRVVTREDDENFFVETRDQRQKGAWIHRNYIIK